MKITTQTLFKRRCGKPCALHEKYSNYAEFYHLALFSVLLIA